MDDLLSGLAALPDKIMRPRHTPPAPAQEAAFLSVFTGIAPMQDMPLVKDGAVPNGKGIDMVPLLPQALSLVQPDLPPQATPLPDAAPRQMPSPHAVPLPMPATPLAAPVTVAGPDTAPAAMPVAGVTLVPKAAGDVPGRPHDDTVRRDDTTPLAVAGFDAPVLAAGPDAAPPASGDGAARPKDASPGIALPRDLPGVVPGMPAPVGLAPLPRAVPITLPPGTLPVAEPGVVSRDGQAKPAVVQPIPTPKMPAPGPGPEKAIAAPPKDVLALADRTALVAVSVGYSPRPAPATHASDHPLPAPAMPAKATLQTAPHGPLPAPMTEDAPALPQGKPIAAVPAPMVEAPIAPDIAVLPQPMTPSPMAKGPAPSGQGPVAVAATGLPRMVWSDTAMATLPMPQPGQANQPAVDVVAGTGAVMRPLLSEGVLPVTPAPVPPAVTASIPVALPAPVPVTQVVPPPPAMAMVPPPGPADPTRGPASVPFATVLSDLSDPAALPLGLASVTAHGGPGRLGLPPPDLVPLAQSAGQQIASGAAQLQADPGGPIDIALDPPELGRVRLSLVEVNGTMTLSITAERPETAELMRRNLALLTEEFSRQGIDAPAVDISGGGQGGRHRHTDDPAPSGGRHDPQPLGQIAASPATARPTVATGLDLRL